MPHSQLGEAISYMDYQPGTISISKPDGDGGDDGDYSPRAAEAPTIPRTRSHQSLYEVTALPTRLSSLHKPEMPMPVEPDFTGMDDTYREQRNDSFGQLENAWSSSHHLAPVAPPRRPTSPARQQQVSRPVSPETVNLGGESTRSPSVAKKSIMSKASYAPSSASSFAPANSALPALQMKGAGNHDGLEPLTEEEVDPASFDLVVPANAPAQYSLETRSELLFSKEHLQIIFEDPTLLQRFTTFLCAAHPASVPLLGYYLDTLKALKALDYVNSITSALTPLDGFQVSHDPIQKTVNDDLQAKADMAFELLTREDLPAYITHTWVRTVSVTIKRRIADTLPVHLRDLSEGLAEVFCLTDPSRPDNPIIFASEEFHRTTQYGMNYVLGRNCRFLQGPKTNPASVRRLRDMIKAGKDHCETFLNYRRDGSPFMNLLMVAPLFDSRGNVRYFIGAQVDVSGLAKECSGLESLERLVERQELKDAEGHHDHFEPSRQELSAEAEKDEFRNLAEMFSLKELKTVREHGGSMHRTRQATQDGEDANLTNWNKPRLLIKDDASMMRRDSDPIMTLPVTMGGKLSGIYEHYLLVRPYPAMKILFASPTMRVPGMLQSDFLSRIGGSRQVHDALTQAFADGHGVTAKIRWLSDAGAKQRDSPDSKKDPGKGRWIHCTPLLGGNGAVGVWMVVLVEDEADASTRRTKIAPPVPQHIHKASLSDSLHGQDPATHRQQQQQHPHMPEIPQQYRNERMQREGFKTPDVDDISLGGVSFLDRQQHSASAASHHYPTPCSPRETPSNGDLKQLLSAKRQTPQRQSQQQQQQQQHRPQSPATNSTTTGSVGGSLHARSPVMDRFPGTQKTSSLWLKT